MCTFALPAPLRLVRRKDVRSFSSSWTVTRGCGGRVGSGCGRAHVYRSIESPMMYSTGNVQHQPRFSGYSPVLLRLVENVRTGVCCHFFGFASAHAENLVPCPIRGGSNHWDTFAPKCPP